MVKPSRIAATNNYIKKHTRRFTLQCNKKTEADIIAFLEGCDNYNKVLKELIREKISKSH